MLREIESLTASTIIMIREHHCQICQKNSIIAAVFMAAVDQKPGFFLQKHCLAHG